MRIEQIMLIGASAILVFALALSYIPDSSWQLIQAESGFTMMTTHPNLDECRRIGQIVHRKNPTATLVCVSPREVERIG